MRIVYNNKEIVINIGFSKPLNGGESLNQARQRRTRCTILYGDINMRDNDKAKVGDATVRCDSRDQVNLVYARRAALAKALNTAVALSDDERQFVWENAPLRKCEAVQFEQKSKIC